MSSPVGASDTGSWLIPKVWSVAMASPTRSVVRATTTAGRSVAWWRSASSVATRAVAPAVASRPFTRIHSSL